MPRFTKDTAKRFRAPSQDEILAYESNVLVANMHHYVSRWFGKRCKTFEPNCPVCEMWAKHDSLKAYICD